VIPPFGPRHHVVGRGDPAVFAFRFDRLVLIGPRAVHLHPTPAHIEVGSAGLTVRFGPWRVTTQRGNVAGAAPSGRLPWWRSVGVRYSAADRRLILGSSRYGAVSLSFDRPAACVHLGTPIRLMALTVTTTEPDELAAAVRAFA